LPSKVKRNGAARLMRPPDARRWDWAEVIARRPSPHRRQRSARLTKSHASACCARP
jgi:hypothetical protein